MHNLLYRNHKRNKKEAMLKEHVLCYIPRLTERLKVANRAVKAPQTPNPAKCLHATHESLRAPNQAVSI